MPSRTVTLEDRVAVIPTIFDQAQNSVANHPKNFVALYKNQAEAAKFTESLNHGKNIKLVGEKAFQDTIVDALNRVLPVKKGVQPADRIVKFVGGYIKFMNEKSAEPKEVKAEPTSDDEGQEDTFATRLIARLIRHFLKGFVAKDKNVRYRCVQFVAEMISHLGEIEDEVYQLMRSSLMERVKDKEAFIRAVAVVALSKLAGAEDPDDLGDDAISVIDALVDILRYDSSPDVRRAALLHTPPTTETLPDILTRTRDIDPVLRKLLYTSVLLENLKHPKQLTIAQREKITRDGLGDREPAVRAAAGKLLRSWVDIFNGNLEEFLQLFDLLGEGEEGGVASEALKSIFVTRVDVLENLKFDEEYWQELTPPKAFLARVFVEHCIATKDDARLENALPVVTSLAFKIQSAYNVHLERIAKQKEALDEDDELEDEDENREFVIGEMLRMAVHLDYADEIGRRKVFGLVREMLSHDCLPQSLVTSCLDVLRTLSSGERDLIRVVVEVIQELRDPGGSDVEEEMPDATMSTMSGDSPRKIRQPKPPPAEMTEEEKTRATLIDIRCLDLCRGMLERVNGTFEENSTLEGVLTDLIVPAVRRKEMVLREKGLLCLGLCCLIAKKMAISSFGLFLSQVQTAPEVLKIRVLQVLFDILMVHGKEFLSGAQASIPPEKIIDFLVHVLNEEESPAVLSILVVGVAKLMLSGLVTDERILKTLVATYFSPETTDNQQVRQCLSYFFPVYCYSSPVNQRRLQKIALPTFEMLCQMCRDDEDAPLKPAQMGALLLDWLDPRKAVQVQGTDKDPNVHFDVAMDIMYCLLNVNTDVETKKVLCGLLSKLYLPETIDDDQINKFKLLFDSVLTRRPMKDTTARNALARFSKTLSKLYAEQLKGFSEVDLRKLESLTELFEYLDDIIPDDDDEVIELPATRKRSSKSR
ncbi:hypothetical protein SISSUDRAFT_988304 [Sistotremastrum suecicum HHB10207 ss-3]|uniref:Nuclear condensin complex subunit 3 C-terminal domain-containing protein n=1 Tax=Sistotremastrum suecicum HHB10207 ss-3 TaxID=1314776 RepID=A0A166C3B5_9AGAM|nr:hypothetical protein SISSUDRAFT_988304 [Sistotremastrum suecicum HHB10207 ss-3]